MLARPADRCQMCGLVVAARTYDNKSDRERIREDSHIDSAIGPANGGKPDVGAKFVTTKVPHRTYGCWHARLHFFSADGLRVLTIERLLAILYAIAPAIIFVYSLYSPKAT